MFWTGSGTQTEPVFFGVVTELWVTFAMTKEPE